MQTGPEVPPSEAAESERVARILERYGAERELPAEAAPRLATQVQQALAELTRPGEPSAPRAAPARVVKSEPEPGIRRWQRLVMAAVAIALIALFWQRLGWIG